MAKTDNKVRSMPWAVKLLLTVLIGRLFPITVLIIPPDAFLIPIPDEHVGAVCSAAVLITTFAVPTVLYLREGDSWRRSLFMGLAFGVVGSALLFLAGYGLVVLMERLLMI